MKLRIELEAHDGRTAWAEYDTFRLLLSRILILQTCKTIICRVEAEDQGYRLRIGGYSGTAGDAMDFNNGRKFSTQESDNDLGSTHCAQEFKGA